MKTCFKCGERKPLTHFYRHPQMADGHLNKCKDCTKRDVRQHRRANESVREYDRKRAQAEHRKKARAEYGKRYRAQNRDAERAHRAVTYAVQTGKLKKQPCAFCGSGENLHAHHRDYSRPLDVDWLCAKCHHRAHALFGEAA